MEKNVEKIKKYNFIFIGTMILGLLAHLFMLTNKLPNHDDIESLFSKGVTNELGRWGLELIQYILPNFSMPWLNGIILLICIAVSACIIAEILKINSKVKQILIGGIMITYASVTCTLAYMFTASAYGIAILLSVLSVYFAIKNKKINIFFSIICLTLSISIYQAYISLAITLFVILLIQDCSNENKDIKQILKKLGKFALISISSLVIYLIIMIIVNKIANVSLSNYQGASELGNISIISILKGIINSYAVLPRMILRDLYGISAGIILKACYLITISLTIIFALIHLIKIVKINKKKAIIYAFLGVILPITMNLMYIINPNVEMHSLILYSNCLLPIIPIILIEKLDKSKLKDITNKILVVTLSIIIFKYIIYANECYLQMELSYENTHSFYTTLVTRIEQTEGFNSDTKIAFIGSYSGAMIQNNGMYFSDLEDFTGIFSNVELINAYSKKNFIKYYIGVDFKYETDERVEELENVEEVKEMNVYPYDGSIKKIENTIVVKF